MSYLRPVLVVLGSALLAAPACARDLAHLEIFDRAEGRTLPLHWHEGRLYVAGEPGHEYEIRIRSHAASRVLAVTSVDGVNVITGQTASPDQSGYVLEPWQSLSIAGWRKSLDRVARFYFTSLPDSYAARTGRPDNVGVIGVAFFRPKTSCCRHRIDQDAGRSASTPSAAAEAQADESLARRQEPRLGTGHGQGEQSPAEYTRFERASPRPDQTIVIYYDSYRNLVAQGVIPARRHYAEVIPEPFPAGFVPDP